MKLNIYKNRYSSECEYKAELKHIFETIKSDLLLDVKEKRFGVVYATTSLKGRKHEHIESFTGLVFIDVDKCTNAVKVKSLFQELDCTVATWFSSSGNVHALIKIPVCKSIDEYKRRYALLTEDLRSEIGDMGLVDNATSNPTQLAFISHDKELYVNTSAEEYEGMYLPNKPRKNRTIVFDMYNSNSTKWCVDKVNQWFSGINSNGYPQVLKYSVTLGGWASAGYIKEKDAENLLQSLIKGNAYLNSTDSSGTLQTYLNASLSAFKEGLKTPLHWH